MTQPQSLDLGKTEDRDTTASIFQTHRVLAVSIQFHRGELYKIAGERFPVATANSQTHSVKLSMILVLQAKQDLSNQCILQPLHCLFPGSPGNNMAAALLDLPVSYVGYDMTSDICWMRHFGLPVPQYLWDVRTARRILSLGEVNAKARTQHIRDQHQAINSLQTYKHQAKHRLELHAIAVYCGLRIGIQSPLLVQLRIYQVQKTEMEISGCLRHFTEVEMPWQEVVAGLYYNGVRIDPYLQETLLNHALQDKKLTIHQLQRYGITNPDSRDDVWQTLKFEGLDRYFFLDVSQTKFSLKDDLLEAHQDKHPVLALLRRHRKVRNLISVQHTVAKILTKKNTIHPNHVQLGTETGRQTCHDPNLLGFDRIQRNLVIPDPGCGIAEVDYSQHEVGIAAGLYRDQHLTALYNNGDVYTQIAQSFYAHRPETEQGAETWPEERFRERYPQLRSNLKVVTLAVLYGQGAYGLAQRFAISEKEAAAFLDDFSALFPDLQRGMEKTIARAEQTGYVELINGVRITIDKDPAIMFQARHRYARNYPIQGSGAIVFKTAGVRLKPVYKKYGARLLVPMHDAFIFQAPLDILDEVVEATSREMISAMKTYFPDLEPKVNANTRRPQCWVKDGYETALAEYLEEASNLSAEMDT